MSPERDLIVFEDAALTDGGKRATFQIRSGEMAAVMGEAASGKTFLLDAVVGRDKARRGHIGVSAPVRSAGLGRRRGSPMALARAAQGRTHEAGRTMQCLNACGLFGERETPLSHLSSSQVAAVSILEVLCSRDEIGVFDGHLDALDPWAQESILSFCLAQAEAEGRCFLAATNQPDLAEHMDKVIVVRDGGVAFFGSPRELVDSLGETRLEVEAHDGTVVQSLAEELRLSVEISEGRMVIRTGEPEAEAARLLRAGFGSIRSLVTVRPSFREALLRLP